MRPPNTKTSQPCKVCSAVVRRRRDHLPSTCEACQKFFRRTLIQKRDGKLVCSSGSSNCTIAEGRRICSKCRFLKCIRVGMKSKFLNSCNADADSTNEVETESMKESTTTTTTSDSLNSPSDASINLSAASNSSGPTTVSTTVEITNWRKTGLRNYCSSNTCIILDPNIFDVCSIEKIFQASLKAYTELSGFDWLEMRVSTEERAIENMDEFRQITDAQIATGYRVVNGYGNMFRNDLGNLTPTHVQALTNLGLSQLAVFYWNLPNSKGGGFFGVSDNLTNALLKRFPAFQNAVDTCNIMANKLSIWNPNYPEASMMAAMIYLSGYKGGSRNRTLEMVQQNLESASRMKLWQLSSGDYNFYQYRLSQFEQIINLGNLATYQLYSAIAETSSDEDAMMNLASQVAFMANQVQVLNEDVAIDVDGDDDATIDVVPFTQ